MNTPEQLVQQQLDSYNAKDVEGWLATYHPNAEQYELHGPLVAAGHEAMRARIEVRFTEPNLHARLLSRIVMGDFVVDHEEIQRTFAEGRGTVEMLCVYQVSAGRIIKASFALANRRLGEGARAA